MKLSLLFALFGLYTACVQASILQFNVTPHSSEVIFTEPRYLLSNNSSVSYLHLDHEGQESTAIIRELRKQGVEVALPSNKVMRNSETLPLAYTPKWQLDHGQYYLSIPEVSRYPIAVNARLGHNIFHLANLVVGEKVSKSFKDFLVVIGWWEQPLYLSKIPLTIARLDKVTDSEDYHLVPICKMQVPSAKGIALLKQGKQADIHQLMRKQHCEN